MGKKKVKKRISLQKQFTVSYAMILVLSLVTSLMAILTFYFFYHRGMDMNSLSTKNISHILNYSVQMGSSLQDRESLIELDRLTKEAGLTYYIKSMDNKMLYSPETENKNGKPKSSFKKRLSTLRNNFVHTSSMNIPLIDKRTGSVSSVLVIIYPGHLILIDALIPFVCFIMYTLLFSRSFSRKIKKPIDELMEAVRKIKNRNLDFSISNEHEDEIGDLSRAFEDMRSNLQNSLMREWQLEQDRRDMVAAVTHDLRTPLAIIQGHIEVLQDGLKKDGDKLDQYLDIIAQNSDRARQLIDEMNSLSEIDSTGFVLNSACFDLKTFLKDKTGELQLIADGKSITLETVIIDERKDYKLVFADCSRLSQVIDNIIGNSLRYTSPGGNIQLNVKIEDTKASFRITDTGQGFSEKDLANLFKKFYKGDSSRSVEKGHCGLGLYISKSIIEKSGGEIKASNLPSGGACVDFFITYL